MESIDSRLTLSSSIAVFDLALVFASFPSFIVLSHYADWSRNYLTTRRPTGMSC
jgi:hypothetical protein